MVVVALGQQYNVGEKPAIMLVTYTTSMQVHQKRGESPRCTKINFLQYAKFCLLSDSSIGEYESVVGCTFNSSGIGSTLKYKVKRECQSVTAVGT